MVQLINLPSGLRLLVEELPHTHSISLGVFIGVGAGHETKEISGISHFIEHLLFKGSEKRPTPKAISDAIEGIGGILDAYTSFDSTVYYAKVADIHFDRAVDVLSDMVIHPRFAASDIEKERRVIIEELRQTEDTPSDLVHNLLDTALWGDQALGRDIAGDEDSVNSISREAILQFWKQHYNRNNMVISVAGNVTNERAALAIEAAFAELSDGATSQYIPSLPPQPGPNMVLQHDDSEQSNFCLGFSAISQDDPDRRALMVFDTIMGGSMSSRLFQEIREERGLAYNVGSYSREDHDTGKWLVYGSVEPSKLEECIATIMAELRRVLSEGITPEELQQVKEQVKGGVLLSLEDTWSVAARNGSQQLRYDTVIPVEQVVAEVEAVTQEDVQRVARRVLHENTLHLAVIGPHDDEEAATLRALLTLGA